MSEICVVHLVWAPLGTDTVGRFLASYRKYSGGVRHDLAVVFNGFNEGDDLGEYHALLKGLRYESLRMPAPMQDIPAYFAAAASFAHDYFCFLNSYSELLDGDWLAKLYEHAGRERVGIVGATGSWESIYSNYLRYWRRSLPWRPYRGVVASERGRLRTALALKKQFAPFPNYHVRSNAFLIEREVMLRLETGEIIEKADAHRFESGRASMTRQLLTTGMKPLIVGRDGRAYEKEHWHDSFTFKRGEQENLLVADNQTRAYAEADVATRRELIEAAWGKRFSAARSFGPVKAIRGDTH
ncbi:MAG TPA: hypothetical protein VF791_03565 [Pyrinomonadaceae bacterium]